MADIHSLLASRICHDLASPLGALGNGIELLMLDLDVISSSRELPELDLVRDTVGLVQAQLKFMRIAYGHTGILQETSQAEINHILSGLNAGSRLQVHWEARGAIPREEAQLAFLLLQCIGSALPRGGEVRISRDHSDWSLQVASKELRNDKAAWSIVLGEGELGDLMPGQIHFFLANASLLELGFTLDVEWEADSLLLKARRSAG